MAPPSKMPADLGELAAAPGTERLRRYRPKLRYELVGCGLHGHELLGTDAARLRPADATFARDDPAGFRWYRCLRCDAWVALPPPAQPPDDTPPERDAVELPLRGRPLRDRYVLRFIAVERAVHVVVLAVLVVAIFAFAAHRSSLDHSYTRILAQLQGGLGGPVSTSSTVVKDLDKLFAYTTTRLYEAGAALGVYTALLALETGGLWWARRWAEYLTFVETGVLVPYEVYELVNRFTPLKAVALIANLAVLAYLLYAHRLFGVRGGGRADRAERERDTGWPALERATPPVASSAGVAG